MATEVLNYVFLFVESKTN